MTGVAPMVRVLPFQLATLEDRAPRGAGWVHEVKLDGYRIQCQIRDGRARLVTRNGQDWTDRFPAIARDARALVVDSAVLDGEVVALDAHGRSSFALLQEALHATHPAHPLEYRAFDVLVFDGVDVRRAPFSDRRRILEALLAGPRHRAIRLAQRVDGHDPWRTACRRGLEGVVSKRLDAPYEGRRSHTWVKSKCTRRQEFVVGGFTEPRGGRRGLGALLLGVYEQGGKFRYAGKVGTGFGGVSLPAFRARLQRDARTDSPFDAAPAQRQAGVVTWVEPSIVVEVRFTEWTRDGLLRHPVFEGIREDKDARLVRRE